MLTNTMSCYEEILVLLMYVYLYFEYQYTALPIVFVALRQRVASEERTIRGFQEWQPTIHTVPYLYSSTHNCHKALRDIPESVRNTHSSLQAHTHPSCLQHHTTVFN